MARPRASTYTVPTCCQPSGESHVPDLIEMNLRTAGFELPNPAAPAANYVAWQLSGKTLWVSGQLPLRDGGLVATGQLGGSEDICHGFEAARWCALNLLAQAKLACEHDLTRLRRCLKLVGFVSSTAGFVEQHKVMNGASELIVMAMGDAGRHARSAVGVTALPHDAAVEVEGVFELG
jgi:enamine deaminase RidA (YjgF/YER057c/UK114 family)